MRTYRVRERSAFNVLMRVATVTGNITIANTSSITWAAYPEAGGAAVASGSLTVATSVYDTLQLEDGWTEDAIGFNTRHDVGDTVLTDAGRYVIQYRVTPVTGSSFFAAPIVVEAEAVYTA